MIIVVILLQIMAFVPALPWRITVLWYVRSAYPSVRANKRVGRGLVLGGSNVFGLDLFHNSVGANTRKYGLVVLSV